MPIEILESYQKLDLTRHDWELELDNLHGSMP